MDTAKTMTLHRINHGKTVRAGGSHQGLKTQRLKMGSEWARYGLDMWLESFVSLKDQKHGRRTNFRG